MAFEVNDIIFNNSLSGNTFSANTIFSAGTDMSTIFASTASTSNNVTQINNKANKSGDTFTGAIIINSTLTVTGNTSLQRITGSTILSGNSDLSSIFASTASTNNFQTQINNKANLSGDTFTGNVNVNANFVVTGTTNLQRITGTTILSGNSDLSSIFASTASTSNFQTQINNKANKSGDTFTGALVINNTLTVTGDTSLQRVTGTTILSGNSDLSSIFTSTASTANNLTQINNKANKSGDTFTGALIVNNTLTVTGTTSVQTLTATTLFSGNTDISKLISAFTPTTGTLFTQTQDKTIISSVTEATLFSGGSGSLTIGANYLTTGKTISVNVRGYISRGSGNITFRSKLSGTTLLTSATASPGTVTNDGFEADIDITCRTTGTGGTVSAQGRVMILNGANNFFELTSTAPTTINTTVANTIDFTAQWSIATASNTITATNAKIISYN